MSKDGTNQRKVTSDNSNNCGIKKKVKRSGPTLKRGTFKRNRDQNGVQ